MQTGHSPSLVGSDTAASVTTRDILRFQWRAWKYRLGRNCTEIRLLRDLVRPGDTVVDAGAHKGAFTWWLRQCTGDRGRVAAFEPQADLAAALAGIASRLSWDNVWVQHAALSSTSGEGRLLIPCSGSPGAKLAPDHLRGAGHRVTLTTLDDWFSASGWPDPVFIKLDCEGHEPEILMGGARLLERSRPHLLLELEHRHLGNERFRGVLDRLHDLGYVGWFIRRGSLCTADSFVREKHQAETRGEWWKGPEYCNNFLFSPKRGRMR